MKKFSYFFIVILLLGTFTAGVNLAKATTCTPASGYSYCRSVTVNSGQVPSSQTNFTWLVCANSTLGNGNSCPTVTGLNQTGAGAHVTNSSGYDIVLTSDSAGTTLLNWELEKYVASTGELLMWVKSASLAVGTVIYVSYGNSSISSFQGGTTGSAWDSNYKGVYHLPDGTTLSANDSTANGNNAVFSSSTPIAATGQMDGGMQTLASSNQSADTPVPDKPPATWSGWIKITTTTGQKAFFGNPGGGGGGLEIRVDQTTNTISMLRSQAAFVFTSVGTVTTNVFAFITVTCDSSGNVVLYRNGNTPETFTSSQPSFFVGHPIYLGFSPGGESFTGVMDEMRISSVVRSGDWITTEYNSEFAPATFETWGSENSGGSSFNFFFLFNFI